MEGRRAYGDGRRERTTVAAATAAQVTTAIGVVQPGDDDEQGGDGCALPGNGRQRGERCLPEAEAAATHAAGSRPAGRRTTGPGGCTRSGE